MFGLDNAEPGQLVHLRCNAAVLSVTGSGLVVAPEPKGRMSQSDILFERRGTAGIVTLNRPKALNAVTLAMVRALTQQLDEWAENPAVTRVVLTAAGERAF